MIKSSYISEWRYPPGMSNVAPSWPSCVSTFAVINTDLVETLGESTSSFFIVYQFFLLYANACPFMYPLQFSFSNIIDTTTSDLCLLVSFGWFHWCKYFYLPSLWSHLVILPETWLITRMFLRKDMTSGCQIWPRHDLHVRPISRL